MAVQSMETIAGIADTTGPAVPMGLLSVTETVDMITTRIYAVVGTVRIVHDDADQADPASALLHTVIDNLEKEAWLLKSEITTA
jgi:starvation-inducible DNA-binding protein